MKNLLSALLLAIIAYAAAAQDAPAPVDPKLDGEWLLCNINGQKVTGDERPYLHFDMTSHRLYGSNGCNVLNADIEASGTRIKFVNMLTTNVYCADSQHEYLMNLLLERVHSYKISQYANEYYLDLINAQGQVMMVFRKHNMDFLNGLWRVEEIDGNSVGNVNIEVAIDLPLKHIHANAGCNIMNGEIFIDPAKNNSVTFMGLATTRATCPDIETETNFLVALEEVEYAFADGASRVKMVNKRGHEVLILRRVQ